MAGRTCETPMPAEAKWAQIADGVRVEIKAGEVAPGDKLPSTSELCRQHDVSAIVDRQAINALKIEALVEGVSGIGVFVAER
ncbi:winged helix-turn-helix domain-containing protein [Micromonospora trifolii]|uniref:winged helix-turn-helix domain-containing protein n=1 Tax=Micromonospora trifolii TaxID=2911208 RepID=UPI003D2F3F55